MKKLKIPELRMPTLEDHQAASAIWLEYAGPCFIDQWPSDLLALSCPTIFIDLPQDLDGLFEPETFKELAAPIANEIDRKLGWDRRFFRLNSRSPKDALWPFEFLVSCSGKEIMHVLASSERIMSDAVCFKYATAKPKLCLREFWPDVSAATEYRCFIRDGTILAVAEYRNRPEGLETPSADTDRELRSSIENYLIGSVMPRLHLKTVVVDVCWHREWRLLEINPYGYSDPVGAQTYAAIENSIPLIARLPRI